VNYVQNIGNDRYGNPVLKALPLRLAMKVDPTYIDFFKGFAPTAHN
jgi:hypothetical protein